MKVPLLQKKKSLFQAFSVLLVSSSSPWVGFTINTGCWAKSRAFFFLKIHVKQNTNLAANMFYFCDTSYSNTNKIKTEMAKMEKESLIYRFEMRCQQHWSTALFRNVRGCFSFFYLSFVIHSMNRVIFSQECDIHFTHYCDRYSLNTINICTLFDREAPGTCLTSNVLECLFGISFMILIFNSKTVLITHSKLCNGVIYRDLLLNTVVYKPQFHR